MYEFKLPDLGEGIHEGEILEWHVKAGQTIGEDEPLVEIETDKAAVTIPSPKAGKVVSTTGGVGEVIKVGQVLVRIDDGSGAAAQAAPAPQAAPPAAVATVPAPAPAAAPVAPVVAAPAPVAPVAAATVPAPAVASARVSPEINRSRPVPAAPATRRLARELGVDLHTVSPSGPGGRVTADDVRRHSTGAGVEAAQAAPAAAEEAPAVDEPVGVESFSEAGTGIPYLEVERLPDFSRWGAIETEPVRSIRRKIARKMVSSMLLVPHVAHMDEADVTELDALRKVQKKRLADKPGGSLSLLPFIMRAVVRCLKDFPMFNASLDPHRGEIIYKKYYNVGVAADTPRGLIVPVVKDTDRRTVLEISAEVARLGEAARGGKLDVKDLQGGTFTVTNVGAIGGTGMVPTINYPEVAILGLARGQQKPVVRDGQIVVRTMLPMTLCFDHRIADGANAARFMNQLVYLLADPQRLLLES